LPIHKAVERSGDRILFYAIILMLIQSAISQLTNTDAFIISPTNQFELIFFLICLLQLDWRNFHKFIIFFWTSFYLILNLILSLQVGTNAYDYLKESKWIIYLLAIYCTKKEKCFSLNIITRITKLLLISFLIGYGVQVLNGGLGVRPIMFGENNYEMGFLLGMYLISEIPRLAGERNRNIFWYISLAVVVALSGSRSGGIGFLILSILVMFSPHENFLNRSRNIILFLSGLTFITNNILIIRGSNIKEVDRFHFLTIFISEMRNRNLWEILFGTFGVRELDENSCHNLVFYSSLLADQQLGTCYATILHLFILRVIINFGILGLVLSVMVPYFILKNSKSRSLSVTMIALSIINGLSVSGINNVFVMLPILIAVTVRNQESSKI
jgi:hypothetical protein